MEQDNKNKYVLVVLNNGEVEIINWGTNITSIDEIANAINNFKYISGVCPNGDNVLINFKDIKMFYLCDTLDKAKKRYTDLLRH